MRITLGSILTISTIVALVICTKALDAPISYKDVNATYENIISIELQEMGMEVVQMVNQANRLSFREQQNKAAAEIYQRIIGSYPDKVFTMDLYRYLGYCYKRQNLSSEKIWRSGIKAGEKIISRNFLIIPTILVLVIGVLLYTLINNAEAQVTEMELRAEEEILVNMLDKLHKKGFERYQTAGYLIQFAITFWQTGKYEVCIAECEKVMRLYPDDVDNVYDAFRWKQKVFLRLGKIQEAKAMLGKFRGDARPVPWWDNGRLYLHLERATVENLTAYYVSMGDFEQAIRWYREVIKIHEQQIKECHPRYMHLIQYFPDLVEQIKLGDLYRLWGKYEMAIPHYQHALNYLNSHDIKYGGPGGVNPKYEKYRDEELPRLIQECQEEVAPPGSLLEFRRNVAYKEELWRMCLRDHGLKLADKLSREMLQYLSSHPLPVELSAEEVEYYTKLRDVTLPDKSNTFFKAKVDAWINAARFAKFYFGKEELILKYYQKALRNLERYPLPVNLDIKERERYAKLRDFELPQKIEEAQAKLAAQQERKH